MRPANVASGGSGPEVAFDPPTFDPPPLLPPPDHAGRPAPRGGAASRHVDWQKGFRNGVIATDVAIVVAVVFTSQALRLSTGARVVLGDVGSVSYWLVSSLLSALWLAALGIFGAWDRKILGAGASEYGRVMRASFYLFGLVAIISYLAAAETSRSYLGIALPLGLFGLLSGRWVWRRLLEEYRRAGTHLNTVVVVGGSRSAVALATRLRSAQNVGFRVAGVCVPAETGGWVAATAGRLGDFPVVGDLDDVVGAIERCRADMVAVAASESFGSEQVRTLAWKLEGSGVAIALVPALTDVAGPRIHIRPVAGLPLMLVEEPVFKGPKLILKTTVDIIGSLAGIILFSPLLLGVAVAIKLGDPGPVFYRQERVGRGGVHFRVWKFRSMTHRADAAIDQARTAADQQDSVFYKSATDNRVTRVGRFLRRTSIDELPQMFNVLTGQMSLVGPRPLVPGEGAEVGHFLERRMLVRPGITGLWQVSGRSDVSADERVRFDFYYIENWSLASDLVIMARTVRTVLSRRGAY